MSIATVTVEFLVLLVVSRSKVQCLVVGMVAGCDFQRGDEELQRKRDELKRELQSFGERE